MGTVKPLGGAASGDGSTATSGPGMRVCFSGTPLKQGPQNALHVMAMGGTENGSTPSTTDWKNTTDRWLHLESRPSHVSAPNINQLICNLGTCVRRNGSRQYGPMSAESHLHRMAYSGLVPLRYCRDQDVRLTHGNSLVINVSLC